jgi:hypothetical protein
MTLQIGETAPDFEADTTELGYMASIKPEFVRRRHDFNVSKLYGMLPADTSGDPTGRTPADNQTVRNVFVIGPGTRSQRRRSGSRATT